MTLSTNPILNALEVIAAIAVGVGAFLALLMLLGTVLAVIAKLLGTDHW